MNRGNMQRCSLGKSSFNSSSSFESLFDESDSTNFTGNDVKLDTDLTNVNTLSDKDDEDEACSLSNVNHSPEYYLEQWRPSTNKSTQHRITRTVVLA
jgi:hypothetical protein